MVERPNISNSIQSASESGELRLNRRTFISGSAAFFALLGATGAALTPLLEARQSPTFIEIHQKHYRKLTEDEKRELFTRLETQLKIEYGVDAKITDPAPLADENFILLLDLNKCIGCRRCASACMEENNCSRDPQITLIDFLSPPAIPAKMSPAETGESFDSLDLLESCHVPTQCQHCRNPPCVAACPAMATWQEEDGIVVIDANWCIGCRRCQTACPYGARQFNLRKPSILSEEINPNMGYLSNRIRPLGVMEKCTLCLHRVRAGLKPACHDICPTGARMFGNSQALAPPLQKILEKEQLYTLGNQGNTMPRFYYFFGQG